MALLARRDGGPELMRATAVLPVEVLGHVAVEAESLVAGWQPLVDQPAVEVGASSPRLTALFRQRTPVLGAIVVDVVNAEENALAFTATGATRSVGSQDLISQALNASTFPSLVPLGVFLTPALAFGQADLTGAFSLSGDTDSAGDTFPGRDSAPVRRQVNLAVARSAGRAHDMARDSLGLVASPADAFGSSQSNAPLTFNGVSQALLAHLAARLDGAGATSAEEDAIDFNTLNTTHAQIIPRCGWIDIWVGDVALARQMGRYTTTVEVVRP